MEVQLADGRGFDVLVIIAVDCKSTSMAPSGANKEGWEGAGAYDCHRGISTNTQVNWSADHGIQVKKLLTFISWLAKFQWLTFTWVALGCLYLTLLLLIPSGEGINMDFDD